MQPHPMLTETLTMFMFIAVELTALFLLISYLVGVLQAYIPAAKIQSILSGNKGKGYFVAGFLGAITPFCSCSTIPFLKGLLRARANFGSMMVFLFASPLLNPTIIGLLVFTFGLEIALFYFAVSMTVAVIAGYLLDSFGFARYIRPEAYIEPSSCGKKDSCCGEAPVINKWKKIWLVTWLDFKKVLPYLFIGIAIGSVIYGYMPTELVARLASDSNPLAIPVSAVIGIPLYIRAEALIPLSAALASKGMGLGAIMALIIGSAGASLTEVILLKSLFKHQMIVAFLGVVLSMAIGAGYLYSALF
ncbi:permease [Simiduia curdlanivorans]|uniref:Permease n=1 Tax=Simiduia curdlanivorans TaxID=1492769 RepID=A0ABV8V6C5_9GAMM|nr:permease [Simiduia curdlanivorans]MDN3637381.1 permease [Simiduia curdlanivorans]